MEEPRRPLDGPGIDTQLERDALNYKPHLEYTKPSINANYYTSVNGNEDRTLQAFVQPRVLPTWGRAIDIYKTLDELENKFSDVLKDVYAVIPEKSVSIVTDIAKKFGYNIQDRKLPFSLYKKALQSSDSHEKIILQDTFENFQSDTSGILIGELYPDVFEIQQDWKNLLDFIRSGLISQLVNQSKVPVSNSKTDEALALIEEQEKKLSDTYLQVKGAHDQYALQMRRLHLEDPTSPEYFDAQAKYIVEKRRLKDLERRIATKNEVTTLIESKADYVQPLLTSIVNHTDGNVYKGKTFDLLYSLLSQFTSGQEMEGGLRKIQALVKLSIDGKIENTDGLKTNVRTISSNQGKQNVNKSLVKSIHLRNEVYGEVFDTIDGFIEPPKDFLFDLVAGHIVDSVHRADSIYTEQSSDFYKISMLDTELRRDKLLQLVDKDTAREFYKIIDNLISYAKEGRGWPSYPNLTNWLKDFINQERL